MRKILPLLAALMMVFGWTVSAEALLLSRLGGDAVYDTDLDITWLADANVGAGSTFDDGFSTTDGRMTWQNANDWAASLTVGGFTDWRLPTTLDPDSSCTDDTDGVTSSADPIGWNCTGSEMGHLFYNELGGTAGSSILTSGDPDLTLFTNIQACDYWSGTEFAPGPGSSWVFGFCGGGQTALNEGSVTIAWAVRPGDVSAVPEPSTFLLLGSGLVGLIGFGRKKARIRG